MEQKFFFYLSNAITFAASVSGMEQLKYANQALGLVYQNLEWSGILDEKKLPKQKEELMECLKRTISITRERLSPSQEKYLDVIYPAAAQLYAEERAWSMDEWGKELEGRVAQSSKMEGEWHTPKEIREISEIFMQCFRMMIPQYANLSQVILWKQADLFESRLISIESKLSELEKNIENFKDTGGMSHLLTISPSKASLKHFRHRIKDVENIKNLITNVNNLSSKIHFNHKI